MLLYHGENSSKSPSSSCSHQKRELGVHYAALPSFLSIRDKSSIESKNRLVILALWSDTQACPKKNPVGEILDNLTFL